MHNFHILTGPEPRQGFCQENTPRLQATVRSTKRRSSGNMARHHLPFAAVLLAAALLAGGLQAHPAVIQRASLAGDVPVSEQHGDNVTAAQQHNGDRQGREIIIAAHASARLSMPGPVRSAPPPLASFIATQHFQPCYNVSALPSLLDGAVQVSENDFRGGWVSGTMVACQRRHSVNWSARGRWSPGTP